MGKNNNKSDFKKRKKGSDKKKDTFKKYGKNTIRGLRIKEAELEKRREKIKNEGNHFQIDFKNMCKTVKGAKGGTGLGKKMCKITCRDKKHGTE